MTALKKGAVVKRIRYGNRQVMYINNTRVFDNSKTNDYVENMYVFSDILQCIYRTFETHPSYLVPKVRSSYSIKKEPKMLDDVCYVDIEHCYLQVANRLGYINDKDYTRILKSYKDIKIEVCASITSMFKDIRCEYFSKKGYVEREIECNNYFLESARDNIINFSNSIMYNFCKDNEFYFRNVDGVWLPKKNGVKIKKYLNNLKIKYKYAEGKFINNNLLIGSNGKVINL